MQTSRGKRVKCYGCHKPVHISRFAGVAKAKNGRTVVVCDALPCVLKLAELTKQEVTDDQ